MDKPLSERVRPFHVFPTPSGDTGKVIHTQVLMEWADEIAALESAIAEKEEENAALRESINTHNRDCQSACQYNRDHNRCEPYLIRGKTCADCPKDWMLESQGIVPRQS